MPNNGGNKRSRLVAAAIAAPPDEALVNSLVPAGHSSTPGYTDPGHPVEGRVT